MIKNFDLTDWICFSDRRNSKSYMSKDKKWMVKFGTEFTKVSYDDLIKEQQMTQRVLNIGVKTPKVGDIVELPNGEIGLIYEFIEGKKSISRAVSEDLENIDYYMKRFAHIAKDEHSKVCDVNQFESMEDRIRTEILRRDILSDKQKEKALKFLDTVEKKNNCVHGDFHPGNYIITSDKEYAIDIGQIAYGNPDFDIAVFYYFCFYFSPDVTKKLFHCEEKYLKTMWKSFIKYYFDTNDEKTLDEITKKYAKYALVCFFAQFKFINPDIEINNAMEKYFDKEFI